MNGEILRSLMDQAGAPAHPLLFLVLGVVTFALHMVAVNLMLGTLGLAAWGAIKKGSYAERLTHTLIMTAKVAVAFAVVLGVAPLLFVQVIYDGFWYVSNVLSAWWLVLFLVVLIAAYLGIYRAYGVNHTYLDDGRPVARHGDLRGGGWLTFSFVLLLVCGLIMHALANQALFPEKWMEWYAPNGVIDPSGRGIHYVLIPRLLFFLSLSLPVTAGWLFALRRYLINNNDTEVDMGYMNYLEGLAHRLAQVGAVLVLVTGAAWMAMLPPSMTWFSHSIWMVVALVPILFFFLLSPVQKRRRLCVPCNYMGFAMPVIMVMILAALREVLRYGTLLHGFGWDALDYKLTMDWPSTLVFFTTFLVAGGLNISYLVTLVWQSGHTEGVYTPSAKVTRLGQCALGSLVAWIVLYIVIGSTYL